MAIATQPDDDPPPGVQADTNGWRLAAGGGQADTSQPRAYPHNAVGYWRGYNSAQFDITTAIGSMDYWCITSTTDNHTGSKDTILNARGSRGDMTSCYFSENSCVMTWCYRGESVAIVANF